MNAVAATLAITTALVLFRMVWERLAEKRDYEQRMKGPPLPDSSLSLHEACYRGRLARVRELLGSGADPNGPANPHEREWISSAGTSPRPLNCVAIAWAMTESHVEIAKVLIEHGAVVDNSVFHDHLAESAGRPEDAALDAVLRAAHSPQPTG